MIKNQLDNTVLECDSVLGLLKLLWKILTY